MPTIGQDPRLAFRFDSGATWLNLLATRGQTFGAHPVERLASAERLSTWLEVCELTPSRPPGQADVERAWVLRESLRVLALGTVAGEPPSPEATAVVSGFLSENGSRLVAGEHLRWEQPPTAAEALARVARQAADHLTGADRHALRTCPEDDCRGVFTDTSGRRRWCPAPACASRGRVRALRARRRAEQ